MRTGTSLRRLGGPENGIGKRDGKKNVLRNDNGGEVGQGPVGLGAGVVAGKWRKGGK